MIIFYSYSHKDEELRDQLETHLSTLKRQGIIQSWHDRKINAGQDWATVIDSRIDSADVILLLISSDFIASDYCYGHEVQSALERHRTDSARVIPVILRSCDWQSTPFCRLQALPKDGKAVTSWPNRDEAWTDVARGIRLSVSELTVARQSQTSSPHSVVRASTKGPRKGPLPRLEVIASDRLELLNPKMRCIEENNSWWRYSWLFEIKSHAIERVNFDAVLLFVDSDGFIVDNDTCYALTIESQERRVFRGFKLINAQTAGTVKELLIELSLRT